MTPAITSYDGGVAAAPRQLVTPRTVEELQAILTQPERFPSPVRAIGSFHSLTPCGASAGTMVSMLQMKRVLAIDRQNMTFTAEAGLQLWEVADILRRQNLQMMLNPEIGNMTLGSAACCHSKDALDGVESGQANAFVTAVKWVSPSGELAEASDERDPELLSFVRSSYGLCGIVYEVTLRIKPL